MEITKALNDWVVVIPEEKKEKIVGGIIMPETVSEKTEIGTVVAIGPGNKNVDTSHISVGDKILYMKDVNAVDIESEDGKKQIIIRFSSLYAVIK